MTLLQVTDLRVSSPARALVHGVGFTLAPGERLGLVGESGSGKSLSAMSIVGLLPPGLSNAGSIILDGTEVIGQPDRTLIPLRGSVAAVVFQDPRSVLDPLMKIGAQLAAPIRRHAARQGKRLSSAQLRDLQMSWLDRVALTDPDRILHSFPHELSGGQWQRIAIAMALACRPKLLIADEPTTALDVTTQREVIELLDTLVREDNLALLFISHDLAVVSMIADKVVVMQHGHEVERGQTHDVFLAPRHPYTQQLVAAARTLERALHGGALE